MVLEIVANKHGMKVFPINCVSDALKLQDAILSATLNDRDYIILEYESATSGVVHDAKFQELLDLLDGNGFYIIRPNKTYTIVRYDIHTYQRAVHEQELYIAVNNATGFTYKWGK